MFKSLTSFQKFQSGACLWLIFFEPQRRLFKEINWRTAFLLQNFKDKKALSKPVLADTQSVFPNKALLCLPLKKEAWLSDIHSCWNRLDKPSLRVFIPLGYNEEKLQKYWPQSDVFHNLSYYREMKR